jgi:hypothetical protein
MLKVTIGSLAVAAALGGAAPPLHAGLEKMTGITHARAIPAQLTLIAQAQVNPSPPTSASPFDAGLADRREFENWFVSLTGDFQKGAEYWAGHRSLPKPGSCYLADGTSAGEWTQGCLAAQRQLAPSDVRRKAEPNYRQGWNSYAASGSQPTAPSVASTSAPTAAKGADTASPTEPARFAAAAGAKKGQPPRVTALIKLEQAEDEICRGLLSPGIDAHCNLRTDYIF